jgi:hypothetical protein
VWWDILLAVVNFLILCGLTWLGLGVIPKQDRRGVALKFWVLLSLGIVITIFSIVRSVQAQKEMEGKLSEAVAQGMDKARRLEGPHIRIRQYAPRPFIAGEAPSR